MEIQDAKYRITPSLLNSFQNLLDSSRNWEIFYGGSDDPQYTDQEYNDKCEKELLDAINRVPFTSEATSRGSALNEIIDCILEHRPPREGITVERVYSSIEDPMQAKLVALKASIDGFTFSFDIDLVNELVVYFSGSICQYRSEATIETAYGPVILYGDSDYIRRDIVYDLKTTGNYSFPKYDRGWQKVVYPYCLIESGELQNVSAFEYTAVSLRGGNSKSPLITGDIYKESYDYSHENAKESLRYILETFIPWIEAHRNLITHKRIFNQ